MSNQPPPEVLLLLRSDWSGLSQLRVGNSCLTTAFSSSQICVLDCAIGQWHSVWPYCPQLKHKSWDLSTMGLCVALCGTELVAMPSLPQTSKCHLEWDSWLPENWLLKFLLSLLVPEFSLGWLAVPSIPLAVPSIPSSSKGHLWHVSLQCCSMWPYSPQLMHKRSIPSSSKCHL